MPDRCPGKVSRKVIIWCAASQLALVISPALDALDPSLACRLYTTPRSLTLYLEPRRGPCPHSDSGFASLPCGVLVSLPPKACRVVALVVVPRPSHELRRPPGKKKLLNPPPSNQRSYYLLCTAKPRPKGRIRCWASLNIAIPVTTVAAIITYTKH